MFKKILLIVTNMIYKIVHSFHYKKNELLRRVFGLPLYMRSIAAFFVTAAIGRIFCGVQQLWNIKPLQ